jgi:sporadic carbohydrate cluster protein (TIGR04323 family)
MRQVRGYIFSRPFMGERVPQHVQNIVVREYCEQKNLHYLLSATEYAMHDCHLVLAQILADLPEISGIVAYSLFQLPEDTRLRKMIYKQILSIKRKIYFAVEGLHISTMQDCDRIESIWQVRITLPHCLKELDLSGLDNSSELAPESRVP